MTHWSGLLGALWLVFLPECATSGSSWVAEPPLAAQKLAVKRADPAMGRRLGVFRNTYYDFPEERQYAGEPVDVFDANCQPLARVPLEFHDALCMQGSGSIPAAEGAAKESTSEKKPSGEGSIEIRIRERL